MFNNNLMKKVLIQNIDVDLHSSSEENIKSTNKNDQNQLPRIIMYITRSVVAFLMKNIAAN